MTFEVGFVDTILGNEDKKPLYQGFLNTAGQLGCFIRGGKLTVKK